MPMPSAEIFSPIILNWQKLLVLIKLFNHAKYTLTIFLTALFDKTSVSPLN